MLGYHNPLQARASGKTSPPFDKGRVLQKGGSVTLWLAPLATDASPNDDDESNILWRNKNGTPRRLHVLSKGGDAIELRDESGTTIHFYQVDGF